MTSLMQRRTLLRLLAGSALAASCGAFRHGRARAAAANARRVIFFYTPDGVHEADWGVGGRQFRALGMHARDATLLSGLKMDDGEGHNDGAKQVLTGSLDHVTSFDQHLGSTLGSASYHPHLYLSVQSHGQASAGDDWFVSYRGGSGIVPEQDPALAFGRLFPGGSVPTPSPVVPGLPVEPDPALLREKSVLDVVLADLNDLNGRLRPADQRKLDLHLQAVREAERRIGGLTGTLEPGGPDVSVGSCDEPSLSFTPGSLYDPVRFPEVLAAQMDVMVTAMACGLTRVGTIQCSRHTSPLAMPFASSRTMESHEASHNNGDVFLDQRVWFFTQLKALCERLAAREDPDVEGATLLDTTLVLSITEICYGPTHKHTNMPFVLLGGQGGALRSGRAFDAGGHSHRDLMATLAVALGTTADGWSGGGHRVIGGLLG